MEEMQCKENAALFRALADEKRLMILELLQHGELCGCEIMARLGLGQSNLSHHMKVLCTSGIVTSRKKGKWTFYAICNRGRRFAADQLLALTKVKDHTNKNDLCPCANEK